MPVYEYQCQSCQHRFEAKQRISDPPLTACERCGQAVTKLISPPAIMFKGSGWYVTDYSDKLKSTEKSEGQAGEGAKTKEGGSGDAGTPAATASPATGTTTSGTPSGTATGTASSGSSAGSTPSSSSGSST